MSNPRYEVVHGKRILVEDYDIDLPASKNKRPEFTSMDLSWAADMAKASGTPGAMVWVLLHYMAWKCRSQTFSFSNALLTKYSIDRRTKYKVLRKLADAGKIKVERRARKAPIVTMLDRRLR